jgi:predicted RNA-binding protein with PUA-like domain
MAHWLYKTEPSSWSWQQQLDCGAAGTGWTGVRNPMARGYMEKMKVGERGFFYHSGEERRIVGIVEVIARYHPDPTDASGRFGMVDLKAIESLPEPVTLHAVKAEPKLAQMVLVKNSRLSVQPVNDEEWRIVCAMGGIEP